MAAKSIDLHGRRTDEVEDLIDAFLHKAQQRGYKRVRIVTGKGSGRVKNVVTRYLKLGNYPWSYETTDSGRKNEGVLVVHLE